MALAIHGPCRQGNPDLLALVRNHLVRNVRFPANAVPRRNANEVDGARLVLEMKKEVWWRKIRSTHSKKGTVATPRKPFTPVPSANPLSYQKHACKRALSLANGQRTVGVIPQKGNGGVDPFLVVARDTIIFIELKAE